MTKDKTTDPIAAASALPAQMMATAVHFQARMVEQSAEFALECYDFMRGRVAQDIAVTRQLGGCDSVEDAFRVIGEAQKKALEDYRFESARLSMQQSLAVDALKEEVSEDAAAVSRAVGRVAAA